MIQFKDVSKIYRMGENSLRALDHANMHIREGEFVSIIGPSGSGKSTLMNIVGCLDLADEGEYFLDGQEIRTYKEDQLARIRNEKIGFVFQNFNLIGKMTAWDNIELPLIYQRLPRARRKERVEEALRRVGLYDLPGPYPPDRLCFWRMNLPETWIPGPGRKSWIFSGNCMKKAIPLS